MTQWTDWNAWPGIAASLNVKVPWPPIDLETARAGQAERESSKERQSEREKVLWSVQQLSSWAAEHLSS